MLNSILIAGLAVSSSSCEKAEDLQEDALFELSGTWIELIHEKDTIDFDGWGAQDVFLLQRGFETRDGSTVPKYGAGPYRFIIKPDSILVNSMFSSRADYSSYYLHMNSSQDIIVIGNFYDPAIPSGTHIMFYKDR